MAEGGTTAQSGLEAERVVMTQPETAAVYASQWRLMWWKFQSHKLALVSLVVLGVLYFVTFFAQFLTPSDPLQRNSDLLNAPPMRLYFVDQDGHFRPFVYGYTQIQDAETMQWIYEEDRSQQYPLRLFVRGPTYKLWGLFEADRRLFGVEEPGRLHLLGSDTLGRDHLSRMVYGGQISLSIGLVGVFISLLIGIVLGGVSGYYGGVVDNVIQRVIELLRSLPTLPLWMGLAAAVPPTWPMLRVYLMITIILSLVSWTGLARAVRGKVLATREEDFVMAADLGGGTAAWIIRRHLLPAVASYLIVAGTMAIPGMILGETSLSFLGLGLQPPAMSWGVLLQGAQNVRTIALYPWLLSPAVMVIVTVLCFNFVGDGLRDAADPYVR
jgi:peptide/nickel transport system permease protein